MFGKGRPHPLLAGEAGHDGAVLAGLGSDEFVFCGTRFELLELQLALVEQLAAAFGGLPEMLALQFGDHQLQMRDHGLGPRGTGFRRLAGRALGTSR
jgi:hypothetical protein